MAQEEIGLTTGVNEDLRQTSCTPGPDLTPNPLSEVDNARPNGEAPALVSQAVVRLVEGEDSGIRGFGGVAHEASGGMGVQTNHEEEREVVRVPEGLETLVANLVVSRGVHEDHDQKHEVPRDASSLLIVDVEGDLGPDLCGRNTMMSLRAATKAHVVTYGYAQR